MYIKRTISLNALLGVSAVLMGISVFMIPVAGVSDPIKTERDEVKKVLKSAVEIPMRKMSQQLGPHPSDADHVKFKAAIGKVIQKEQAQDKAVAETMRRIQSLN